MESKILIVEDSIEDIEYLQNILQSENYQLINAKNGTTALALLDKEIPDLVILDILLPDIDGYEICRRIRKDERFFSLPVLFHTKVSTIDEKLIGLEMGASDFLTKGSDVRELLVRIRNLLSKKKIIDEKIKFSVLDSLTSTYNRLYFQHRLDDEFQRSKRYENIFSCVIIDVDNFKKVNNTFGYITGDSVLKNLADTMRQNIRTADILCRYGGDEFAALLPETDLRSAYLVAEKMRQFIMSYDLGKNDSSVSLTVSSGVSCFNKDIKSTDVLMDQANHALCLAKEKGCNQTRVYE
ncbi:MAG: hypothetical protein DRP78_04025 [Candidatus Omnitrophota bacterium]|nr:MAG: hypothetical protein DRP78_04025 [Candidatus Omnitrophota bacterium]